MLISKRHRFIFVHVYKNAGISITQALLPFATKPWQKRIRAISRRFGLSPFNPQPFTTHASASDIIAAIGKENFKRYFSFAIVRNPWDWQASLYTYMLKTTDHHQHELVKSFSGFDEYIAWRCRKEVRYQKDFLFSKAGEQLVDFIGRYERLEADFRTICSHIGISTTLPRLNVSRTKPYREYYTEETIELVRKTFEPDIRLFNYDFE